MRTAFVLLLTALVAVGGVASDVLAGSAVASEDVVGSSSRDDGAAVSISSSGTSLQSLADDGRAKRGAIRVAQSSVARASVETSDDDGPFGDSRRGPVGRFRDTSHVVLRV